MRDGWATVERKGTLSKVKSGVQYLYKYTGMCRYLHPQRQQNSEIIIFFLTAMERYVLREDL